MRAAPEKRAAQARGLSVRKARLVTLGTDVRLVHDLVGSSASSGPPMPDDATSARKSCPARPRRLRLVAVASVAEFVLPPVLRAFRVDRPDLDVTLEVGNRARVLERLAYGEADLGFAGRPAPEGGIMGERFLENDLIVVAPPTHPLASAVTVDPTALARDTWLLREEGSGTRRATVDFLTRRGIEDPPSVTLGSAGAVKHGVLVGMGIALISRHAVVVELAQGTLARLRVRDTPVIRSWYLQYRASGEVSEGAAALRTFVHSRPCRVALDAWLARGGRTGDH